MQDFSCNTLAAGAHTALTDNRDGNVYYIAKLADGKCWSTNPLRLDIGSTTFTVENTNNPTSSFVSDAGNAISSDSLCPTSSTASDCNNSIVYNTTNTSTATLNSSPVDRESNLYYYGNYYNWYTATAGNGTTSVTSGHAEGDICPQGWHIPTGDSNNGQWDNLAVALGGIRDIMDDTTTPTGTVIEATLISFPYNFIRSGHNNGDDSSNRYRGRLINSWSSTPVYATLIYTGYVEMRSVHSRYNLDSVVCMANDTTQYSLSFDINGGTGSVPTTQTASSSHAYYDFVIPQSSLTKDHYLFRGWSTDSSATTPDYVASDTISITNTNASIILYAVWEPKTYQIRYWFDEETFITDADTFAYGDTTDRYFAVPNVKNDGYAFGGWSTDPDVAPYINDSNRSIIYGPSERFKGNQDSLINEADDNNYINMYVVWLASEGNMINFTCSSLATGEMTALTDPRDTTNATVYAVAKLADGKCWTVENLRINPSAQGTVINSDNTNNPTSSFVSAVATTQPKATSSFCSATTSACINRIDYNIDNLTNLNVAHPNLGEARYGYGVSYNYYAATAGNGGYSKTSGNVAGDICPKNWRLPTGNTNGEIPVLVDALNGDAKQLLAFPNNFTLPGMIYEGYYLGRGERGWVQTATVRSNTNSYNLFYGDSFLTKDDNSYKYRGRSIRCVAQN
ncbi:InlB B-repeat-containing protein [Candidatus Saccharibacteria bacterium]|nr:InlB B-repeat-containing protein [Candidatus Saccharibacteria bacterium]